MQPICVVRLEVERNIFHVESTEYETMVSIKYQVDGYRNAKDINAAEIHQTSDGVATQIAEIHGLGID